MDVRTPEVYLAAGTGSMTADELAGLVTLNGLIGTALV
jgi:hypothetical protein